MQRISNVQDAVKIAHNYFKNMLPMIGEDVEDLRLEEVELSEDDKFWLITLGYNRPSKVPPQALTLNANDMYYLRDYKIIKVNAETGNVESMKIRKL